MLSVINSFYPLDVLFWGLLVEITMRASFGKIMFILSGSKMPFFLEPLVWVWPNATVPGQRTKMTASHILPSRTWTPKSAVFPYSFPLDGLVEYTSKQTLQPKSQESEAMRSYDSCLPHPRCHMMPLFLYERNKNITECLFQIALGPSNVMRVSRTS